MILALPAGAQPADASGASPLRNPTGWAADGRSGVVASLVDGAEPDEDEDEDDEDDPPPAGGGLRATIGGSATLQAGSGGDVADGIEFRNDVDVYLEADGRMDNGLLYGVRVQIEADTRADATPGLSYDHAYGYLGGRWGRLEFGDTDDVFGGLAVYAPSVGIGQVDGDYGDFAQSSLDDYYVFYPDLESSTRINYYTPTVFGFRAGISYTPRFPNRGKSVTPFGSASLGPSSGNAPSIAVRPAAVPGPPPVDIGPAVTRNAANGDTLDEEDEEEDDEDEDDEDEDDEDEDDEDEDDEEDENGEDGEDVFADIAYRDIASLAVNYNGEIGGAAVAGMAGVMTGDGAGDQEFEDFTAYLGGLQIGIGDVTVGGGIGKFDGFDSMDWQWNVGAAYTTGRFGVGAQYVRAQDVNGDRSWATGIGATYTLAPGLALEGDYVHSRVDFTTAGDVSKADIVILGIRIVF